MTATMHDRTELDRVQCVPWCTYGDGHPGEFDRDDQWCTGAERTVPTVHHPAIRDGGIWVTEYLTTYAQLWARGHRPPEVWVGVGESSTGFHMGVGEARQLAAAILAVCDEVEASR